MAICYIYIIICILRFQCSITILYTTIIPILCDMGGQCVLEDAIHQHQFTHSRNTQLCTSATQVNLEVEILFN